MRKMRLLSALTLLLSIGPGCRGNGRTPKMLQLDQKDNNTEVVITVGQELEISLAENPSTGFRWEVQTAGEPSCTLVGVTFDAPSPAAVGRGGTRRWQFKGAREGLGSIELIYRRASERDRPPAQTFKLTTRVEK